MSVYVTVWILAERGNCIWMRFYNIKLNKTHYYKAVLEMSLKYSSAQFSEILVAAKTIRADLDRGGITTEEVEEKYARIKGEYPMFFKVILSDVNAVKIISFMKHLIERQEKGEITKERADVELGQFMASKYLPTDEELRSRK